MSYEVRDGFEAMGQLIQDWIKNPKRRPKNMAEFKQQTAAAGVDIHIDDNITELEMHQWENVPNTMVLHLPPAELLSEPLPDPYPLPEFYADQAFSGSDKKIIDENRFRNMRIGEYIMQKCG